MCLSPAQVTPLLRGPTEFAQVLRTGTSSGGLKKESRGRTLVSSELQKRGLDLWPLAANHLLGNLSLGDRFPVLSAGADTLGARCQWLIIPFALK